MHPRRLLRVCLPAMLLAGSIAHLCAQSRSDCTKLAGNPKLITNCLEALFSQGPLHFTVSSLPPGNGMALGVALEQQRHYLTTFGAPPPWLFSSHPTQAESQAKLGMTDATLAFIGSENLSWAATGSLSWLPAAYGEGQRKDIHGITHDCNKLGILCTRMVLAIHLEGTHQHLNTLSFYGLGPQSPSIKHAYPQNRTYGNIYGSLPLFDWLAVDGGIQFLQPELPSSSDPLAVSNTFTDAQAPGLSSQPFFVHSHAGFSTMPMFDWNAVTNDAPTNTTGPLMKKNLLFTLSNGVDVHWYSGVSQSQSSFRQVIFSGDEAIQLGSDVRRVIYAHDLHGPFETFYYHLLRRACGETGSLAGYKDPVLLKVTDPCNFGRLDLRSAFTASSTASGAQVPFYLQPTVGGSDFNSQVSLRGYPDYRFRDVDATFSQVEYTTLIRDPVGLLLFYDAGTVGPTFASLSWAHLRQDGGFGATLRLQGSVVAQSYIAWGAGHGPNLGFSFSKLF